MFALLGLGLDLVPFLLRREMLFWSRNAFYVLLYVESVNMLPFIQNRVCTESQERSEDS